MVERTKCFRASLPTHSVWSPISSNRSRPETGGRGGGGEGGRTRRLAYEEVSACAEGASRKTHASQAIRLLARDIVTAVRSYGFDSGTAQKQLATHTAAAALAKVAARGEGGTLTAEDEQQRKARAALVSARVRGLKLIRWPTHRAAKSLLWAASAVAACKKQRYLTPSHLGAVAIPVLVHRLVCGEPEEGRGGGEGDKGAHLYDDSEDEEEEEEEEDDDDGDEKEFLAEWELKEELISQAVGSIRTR